MKTKTQVSDWPMLAPHPCASGHDFLPVYVHSSAKGRYIAFYCRRCGTMLEQERRP
jgi:hypothetical protein